MDNSLKPDFDTINNIAVDNGYADQKLAYWSLNDQGKRFIAEVSYPSRAQMGALNISMDGSSSSGVYLLEGESWTVGKNVNDPEVVRGKRYAYSELNALLINHSLIVGGFSGRDVRLSTGLPFSHYFKNGVADSKLIDKVKSSLDVNIESKSGSSPAKITEHLIYPESTAAFLDYAVCHDTGDMIVEIDNGIVVVDIGGNTTDITSITPEYSIDIERSDTKEIGVLDVRDELRKLIINKFEIDSIKDSQLDFAIRNGECKIFGKSEDISELLNSAKKVVLKKLMNFVKDLVGDGSDVDKILFVGGGAAVLKDVISEYPHAHVPANPEFSNARGMLLNSTFVKTANP